MHGKLSSSGFEDPGSESARATAAVAKEFPASGQSDFVVVVTANHGKRSNDPAVRVAGRALTKQLQNSPGVVSCVFVLDPPQGAAARAAATRPRRSSSRRCGAVATLKLKIAARLSPPVQPARPGRHHRVDGGRRGDAPARRPAENDLNRADLLSAPLTFVALVLVFGGLVAALLPLGVGLLAVLGTFVMLTLLAKLTTVSVFSLNLATGLGLGLSVDYSLFVVSRYREELLRGVSPPVAIGRSMQTAGRTVAFSAGTVAVSLMSLVVFPVPYLRSFAYSGVAVVALAAIVGDRGACRRCSRCSARASRASGCSRPAT